MLCFKTVERAMQKLNHEEMVLISGGECYCCCRFAPILGQDNVRIGLFDNSSWCEAYCNYNPEYSGYYGCYEDMWQCGRIAPATLRQLSIDLQRRSPESQSRSLRALRAATTLRGS